MANRRRNTSNGTVKISAADIERTRREAPEVLAYYRNGGLREVRRRTLRWIITGGVPLIGLLWLGWSPLSMMIYLLADAVLVVLADCLRYVLAHAAVCASHKRDQQATDAIAVIDGLDDGSGTRTPSVRGTGPGAILLIGMASTSLLVPLMLSGVTQKLGLAPLYTVLADPGLPWIVAANAVLHFVGGGWAALSARRQPTGTNSFLFIESASSAALFMGVAALIWLPAKWGETGLLILFFVLLTIRLAFGLFAGWYLPRAVRRLQRRHDSNDFVRNNQSTRTTVAATDHRA